MAKKRKIVETDEGHETRVAQDEAEREEEERARKKEQSLGEWTVKVYARYWYWVLCLAVNVFVGFQIWLIDRSLVATIGGLAFVAVAFLIEFLWYRRLWPEEG